MIKRTERQQTGSFMNVTIPFISYSTPRNRPNLTHGSLRGAAQSRLRRRWKPGPGGSRSPDTELGHGHSSVPAPRGSNRAAPRAVGLSQALVFVKHGINPGSERAGGPGSAAGRVWCRVAARAAREGGQGPWRRQRRRGPGAPGDPALAAAEGCPGCGTAPGLGLPEGSGARGLPG